MKCMLLKENQDTKDEKRSKNPWIPWSSQGMTDSVKLVQVNCDTASKQGNDGFKAFAGVMTPLVWNLSAAIPIQSDGKDMSYRT